MQLHSNLAQQFRIHQDQVLSKLDYSVLPKELRPGVRKRSKRAKPGAEKKTRPNLEERLHNLEASEKNENSEDEDEGCFEFNLISPHFFIFIKSNSQVRKLISLLKLTFLDKKKDEDEDEKKDEQDEEVEEEDEEMDGGTDYANNYFEDGDEVDEEDDNLDEGGIY